jgi:glutathione synthase/RimK-type ligase-like ATP-grasp enzyme
MFDSSIDRLKRSRRLAESTDESGDPMKIIYLMVDYRGAFYSSCYDTKRLCSINIEEIRREFRMLGYELRVKRYSDVDFRKDDFRNQYVLPQDSEDRGSLYKSYIEDVLLGMQLQGAILIPRFECLRAHHNKVFAEILRSLSGNEAIKNIRSRQFGAYEEFERAETEFPAVIKTSAGAGSRGVHLLRDARDKKRFGRLLSKVGNWNEGAREWGKRLFRRGHVPYSLHRRKFIVQNFIPNLQGDYKVLVYGGKHYVVARRNRKNDFRASGSGLLHWPDAVAPEILDFSKSIYESFDVPYASLDIAFDGREAYLMEFQFVAFGTVTLEKSNFYFAKSESGWVKNEEVPNLAREFTSSVHSYITRLAGKEQKRE